jgi:hypothetical protein
VHTCFDAAKTVEYCRLHALQNKELNIRTLQFCKNSLARTLLQTATPLREPGIEPG